MLYHLYEFNRQAFAPMHMAIDQGQHFFRNPLNPWSYTATGRLLAATFDVLEHSTRYYGKPDFGLQTTEVKGREVAVTEEIVLRKPFGQLKHFKRATKAKQPRLLIVAPMSGHFATLLRGTVKAMLPHHDVYITDWRDAKMVPLSKGTFDLDDYVDYLIEFLEHLGPNTHVMAVCQPSVPAVIATALMAAHKNPATPPSLILMGGPIDTRINPTEVNKVATTRPLSWYKQNVVMTVPPPYPGMYRQVYPGFMQLTGFMAMNFGSHIAKHHEMFRHLVEGDGESAESTRKFYEEYRAVMDLTEEFYLETVEKVFQQHLLPKGEFPHRGEIVDVSKITETAIFTIEGERDDISGVGQTKAVHELTPNLPKDMKRHYEQKNVGHYGIFNGRRWREQIAPQVVEFVQQYDQEKAGKKAKPNGQASLALSD